MTQLELFRNRVGEYDVVYQYKWNTHLHALTAKSREWLDSNCEGAWGWFFIRYPSKNHPEQIISELVISFEDAYDLITARFMMPL